VTSRRGSLAEVSGDAAVHVAPEDPEEIAWGMRQVLGSGGKAGALVAAGRRNARRFTRENFENRMCAVYARCAWSERDGGRG
jgi:hypothetical protein